MKDHITINPLDGTLTIRANPELARWFVTELPQHDGFTMSLHQKITELQMQMQLAVNEPCPGSGTVGDCSQPLLTCPICDRVIGVCPPNTLPAHDRPIFNDGSPI